MRVKRLQLLFGFLLLFTAGPLLRLHAIPAQIILIRHAEKPKDDDELHLSKAGRRRADALVPYIKKNSKLTAFGLPVALIASEARKNGNGQRPAETLQPLSRDLKIPVETPFKSDEYSKLASLVLENPDYDGKCVLICWVHEYIPALAEALGVHPPPDKLDDKTYDRVYVIQYRDGKAALQQYRQKMSGSGKQKGHGKKDD
jgi:hypothetical protein